MFVFGAPEARYAEIPTPPDATGRPGKIAQSVASEKSTRKFS